MKRYLSSTILSVLATSLLFASITANAQESAASNKPLTNADVEAIVKKVIDENPDLIIESVQKYQLKKQEEQVSHASENIVKLKSQIEDDPNSPVAGNLHGDVTMVEFFDYHCGYCKQFLPTVTEVLKDDHNLKVVFKEFPILAPDSALAAKASLAVYHANKAKYVAYHTALMHMSGVFTMENLTDKAVEVGISKSAFEKAMKNPDLDKEIDANRVLAGAIGVRGTPGIIVGTELIPGVIPMDELKAKIADARKKKS